MEAGRLGIVGTGSFSVWLINLLHRSTTPLRDQDLTWAGYAQHVRLKGGFVKSFATRIFELLFYAGSCDSFRGRRYR